MIDVNVKGTLYAVRAALPYLVESGEADDRHPRIGSRTRGLPLEAVYCASKFAQVGFTRALDHELRERGDPLHECLSGRRRDRLRARTGTRKDREMLSPE